MRQQSQRIREKGQRMSALAADAKWMLQQLSLPIEPTDTIKARRERAIRRAGLSSAKGMRLWYGQACSLLADEYVSLVEAVKRHAGAIERAAERNHQLAQQLRDARIMREGHLALAIDQETHPRDLGVDQESLRTTG